MIKPRYVSARGVRGLQFGEGNFQLNHFEYRVENCDIDLASVLREQAVQEQLRLLAADPENTNLRRRADALLRRRRFFSRAPKHRITRHTNTTSATQGGASDEVFETFLFVQDSSGVQIANGGQQENYFFYVIAPTIDASDLLRSDAELRSSLIDQVCTSSVVARSKDFHHRLSSSLEYAVLNLPDLHTSGTMVDLRKHDSVRISNEDGVSIGIRGHQQNDVSAEIATPKKLLADIKSYSEKLAPVAAAQPLHRMERELARSVVDTLKRALASDVDCWDLFDALNQTFPDIRRLVTRLRWGSPADMRQLQKYLMKAKAEDCSTLQAALRQLNTAIRTKSVAPPYPFSNPPNSVGAMPEGTFLPHSSGAVEAPPGHQGRAEHVATHSTESAAPRTPHQAGGPPASEPLLVGADPTTTSNAPTPGEPTPGEPTPVGSASAELTALEATSLGPTLVGSTPFEPTPEEPSYLDPIVVPPTAGSTPQLAELTEIVMSTSQPNELPDPEDLPRTHTEPTSPDQIALAPDERLPVWRAASPAVQAAAETGQLAEDLNPTEPQPMGATETHISFNAQPGLTDQEIPTPGIDSYNDWDVDGVSLGYNWHSSPGPTEPTHLDDPLDFLPATPASDRAHLSYIEADSYPPTEVDEIYSPTEVDEIYSPTEVDEIYSRSEIEGGHSPDKIGGRDIEGPRGPSLGPGGMM